MERTYTIWRIPVNSQGYDRQGCYWGTGEKVWGASLYSYGREVDTMPIRLTPTDTSCSV